METELRKMENLNKTSRSGRVISGLLLIGVGALLLAYQLKAIALPRWIFSWEMILIGIGLFTGIRHKFHNPGWIVPVLIGAFFLIDDVFPTVRIKPYFWPLIIMIVGLWLIFKPKNKHRHYFRDRWNADENNTAAIQSHGGSDEYLDSVTVFGGIRKKVFSKNFKGGEIVTFFGGTEYNLTQADIETIAVLEVTQGFGGTKLIVPPHWEVKSEVVAILGGIEDKRPSQPINPENSKVLLLKGTCMFGGIDIRSY